MKVELKKTTDAQYTDITSFIAAKGVKASINSLDADGSGRDLDGLMHRTLVAHKRKFEIKFKPLRTSDLDTLLTLLKNEWLDLKITTATGSITATVYPSATISYGAILGSDDNELWGDFGVSLIEK